ncbi:hypothetical protein DOY81_009689, partial [Sarcophaga bullata]
MKVLTVEVFASVDISETSSAVNLTLSGNDIDSVISSVVVDIPVVFSVNSSLKLVQFASVDNSKTLVAVKLTMSGMVATSNFPTVVFSVNGSFKPVAIPTLY